MLFNLLGFSLKFSRYWGLHFPSSLFFGELDFPEEEK